MLSLRWCAACYRAGRANNGVLTAARHAFGCPFTVAGHNGRLPELPPICAGSPERHHLERAMEQTGTIDNWLESWTCPCCGRVILREPS